ncbi:MAG: peptidase M3A and M3B thimet/oligopeptidase F [bacterium]|nr:peptidase M3A and M3B thimet/oligopeptidase F [bacterium]
MEEVKMKLFVACILVVSLVVCVTTGCGSKEKVKKTDWQAKADAFLAKYLAKCEAINNPGALLYWTAANSGKKEDFDAAAAASIKNKKLHSDKKLYDEIKELIAHKDQLNALSKRSLIVAELGFKGNQLPKETLEELVKKFSEIEQMFNTFRAKVDDKEYSNNDLLEKLAKETDSAKRQKIWESLKQVGEAVAPKLIALAKVRNAAAVKLGYKNYWDMQIRLQEHNPDELIAVFAELESSTNESFKAMKAELDGELAVRFKIKAESMMPWHYDNPFFQQAPPSAKVNLDEFYEKKEKEEIIVLAQKFLSDIGLETSDIIAKSSLYEREGKDQHAFSIDIDRKGDARILVNIKPTAEWMDTTLHELGHAVYSKYSDYTMPYNLRDAAHAFTTEGVAMLFGSLAKNPLWLVTYAGADQKRVTELEEALLAQRRREQLIFARWAMVMFNFEKSFYENPDQDLNKLWWDIKERLQSVKRPEGRNLADWAAKPHFTIAPVYYHNYQLGELYAAQLRSALVKESKHEGPANTLKYNEHKEFGKFFIDKVFKPGASMAWPEFVKASTGEPLTAKHFANELK